MNTLRITRGEDIELYADGELLCGVTDFSVREEKNYHEVYEYLREEPCERIATDSRYTIEMSILSMFHYEVLSADSFTISVIDGDTEYLYSGCRLQEHGRDIKARRRLTDRYIITADKMSERENGNE